jgi:hypothetical protein
MPAATLFFTGRAQRTQEHRVSRSGRAADGGLKQTEPSKVRRPMI